VARKKASKKRAPRKRRKGDRAASAPVESTQDTSLFTALLDLPDLIVLARALRPGLRSYEPEAVAREFLGTGASARTQTGDASVPALRERVRDELLRLPLAVLTEAAWLTKPLNDAVAGTFADAEVEVRNTRGTEERNQLPYEELFAERGEAMRRIMRERREPGKPQPLDAELIGQALGPDGAVARALENYEERPQQSEMARAVATALSVGRHLMVEGGTGVGKSLAYLIPAALWARRTGRPVVVSTHTKNLQHQLFTKDLPLVERVFAELAAGEGGEGGDGGDGGESLRTALIKGRGNYLCVRKLFRLLRTADFELDDAERVALLPVLTWAVTAETGDLSENSSYQLDAPPSLRDKLTSTGDECRGRRCSLFGRCFLQYARSKSLGSDVVVANHALVFAELGLDTPVLPQYEEIVFDEAQHVEDVATEHLAVKSSRLGVMRVLSRLFRLSRSGTGTGLLATAFEALNQAEETLPGELALSTHGALSAAAEAVRPVSEQAEGFFAKAAELTSRRSGKKTRYSAGNRESDAWQEVLADGRTLEGAFVDLAGKVEAVTEAFQAQDAKPIRGRREIVQDLQAKAAQLRELADDLGFVLTAENEQYVYWVEEERSRSRRGPFVSLTGAPVAVAPLLREQLLDGKRSVIFTSATLTVAQAGRGRFDYIASRLGLLLPEDEPEDLDEAGREGFYNADALEVGSPFNYRDQARIFVPRFLPDPRGEREFVAGLAPLLVELFALTQGAGLALFTSYSMLNAAYEATAAALAARGIRLLGQGRDGSRERIIEELMENLGVVVFGTASFWEGVDLPGEALTCLVVAKLPFHVHTEPVVQARCEALTQAGEDPFNSYTLPAAVLRLRQGFGRLIRSRRDRGIVVIADPRLVTTRYGSAFVESLPLRVQAAPTQGSLLKAARDFLEEEGVETA
jgi:Rad3-related DNA helicase